MPRDEYLGAPAHLRDPAMPTVQLHPRENVQESAENQARCDAIQAEFRAAKAAAKPQRRSIRRKPPPLPAALEPTDDDLLARLADELEYGRRMLEQMGDTLSADPMVVARHMVSLQSVDIIGQMLGHIANVVRSSDRDSAVDRIGMGDLKARLLRRGGI